MRLRDVQPGDVDAYARIRCDPVMMAELGGPRPREGIEDKVRRDVAEAAVGIAWIKMIIPVMMRQRSRDRLRCGGMTPTAG